MDQKDANKLLRPMIEAVGIETIANELISYCTDTMAELDEVDPADTDEATILASNDSVVSDVKEMLDDVVERLDDWEECDNDIEF